MDETVTNDVSVQRKDELVWVVHPLKKDLTKSVRLILIIIVVLLAVYICFEEVLFVILAFAFLFGSLKDFFLLTRYRMDGSGVLVKTPAGTIERKWPDFQSFYAGRNGVLLSPYPRRTFMEHFRGVYILFGDNREAVIAFLKEKLAQRDNLCTNS